MIDACARKKLLKSHLTVKIYLVEVAYYLKQVFYLLFLNLNLIVQIDLVKVAYFFFFERHF